MEKLLYQTNQNRSVDMINAREAREIMDNALSGMYVEVVKSIHRDIVRRSKD